MQLFKKDGQVFEIKESAVVVREDLVRRVEEFGYALKQAQEDLNLYDAINAPAELAEPTPAEQAQEIAEEAAELAQELAAPEEAPAPTETPVEAPAPTPETPAPVAEAPVAPVAEAPVASPDPVPGDIQIQ